MASENEGSTQELENIINALRNRVVYIDKNRKIQRVNESAAEAADMEPKEMAGKICHQVFFNRNKPCEDCPVMETLRMGEPEKEEIRGPEGRSLQIFAEPVRNKDSELIGAIENCRDITERKEGRAT